MIKVFFVQKIFSHYRTSLYKKLSDIYEFSLITTGYKHSVNNFNNTKKYRKNIFYFKYSLNESGFFMDTFSPLILNKPKVIIYEFALGLLSLIPTLILSKLIGVKFILHGHGFDRKKGFNPQNNILDKFRVLIINHSDAVILYSHDAKSKISSHINNINKVFVAPNTLNTDALLAIKSEILENDIKEIKKEIGFTAKKNFVFLGRLKRNKKPEICLDILKDIIQYDDDVCFHFVGDGEMMNELKKLSDEYSLNNFVHFYGTIHDIRKTGKMLICSDFMIIPGLAGLSINHSLSFNCPVLLIDQSGHGPEIANIIDYKTGLMAKNINQLKLFIKHYFQGETNQFNDDEINNYVKENLSFKKMIDGFENAVNYALRNE